MIKQDAGRLTNPPIFLRMPQRPVKVLVARNTSDTVAQMPLVFVPIWKCATSSMEAVLVPKVYNCTEATGWYPTTEASKPGEKIQAGRKCRQGPHDRSIDHDMPLRAIPATNRTEPSFARFHAGPHSAGREAAAAWAAGAVTMTIVRDPLTRFISAWNPRNGMEVCQRIKLPSGRSVIRAVSVDSLGDSKRVDKTRRESLGHFIACPSVVHSLEAHAHNISLDAAAFPYWRNGWVHWLSQTYFLSATNAAGKRVELDYVARLERLDSDWAEIAAHLSGRRSRGTAARAPRSNANHGGTVGLYVEALKRGTAVCVICAIYEQDYACLGYELPEECRRCAREKPPARRPTVCAGSSWRCRFADFADVPPFDDTVQSRAWACERAPMRLTGGRLVYNHSACRSVRGTVTASVSDVLWKVKSEAVLGERFPFEWRDGLPHSVGPEYE